MRETQRDKRGAEGLFQGFTEREVKNAIAIASNKAFCVWTKTFTDPRRRLVDRLTFGGTSNCPAGATVS